MATQAQLQTARQAAAQLGAAFAGQVNLTDEDVAAFKDILIKLLPIVWPLILQIIMGFLVPTPVPAPTP